MIINKSTKEYIDNLNRPDENWTGDDEKYYLVDSNSEQAQVVRDHYPNIEFVIDDEGVLLDIIPCDKPIEELINNKLKEVSQICQNAIYAGIDYNDSHYSLTDQDQTNIIVWSSVAEKGKTVPYHADGEHCRPYTPEEFLGLTAAATTHIAHHTTYCNLLMRWVETLTSAEEIESVVYGETQLMDNYLEEYNANMSLLIENATGE